MYFSRNWRRAFCLAIITTTALIGSTSSVAQEKRVAVMPPSGTLAIDIRANITTANPNFLVKIFYDIDINGFSGATTGYLSFHRANTVNVTENDPQIERGRFLDISGSNINDDEVIQLPSVEGRSWVTACFAVSRTVTCSQPIRFLAVKHVPDLEVESFQLTVDQIVLGERFGLETIVRNAGFNQSSAEFLNIYLSDDAQINAVGDTFIGNNAVKVLSRGETTLVTGPIRIDLWPLGETYIGGCITRSSKETNIANNCTPPVLVNVVEKVEPPLPDPPEPPAEEVVDDFIITFIPQLIGAIKGKNTKRGLK